jgi:shikimate kinase / 3-dehydroquinate synthase
VRVVVADEHETGVRALLNLGHTVGHALESHGGYARYLHGEAVAIGTVLEIEACERLGLTPVGLAARAERLLGRLGLPSRAPREEVEAAFHFVLTDKKRDAASIKQPALSAVGEARVEPVAIAALKRALLQG